MTPKLGVITSQNDTAPKRVNDTLNDDARVITSQNDTAPKQCEAY